jgi:CubicO group peptidase (beta-lactamase class C family)
VLRLLVDRDALDEPVAKTLAWLPPLPRSPTVRQLLTHTAGLPADLPAAGDASEVRFWLTECIHDVPAPLDVVTYSDPSYWLLGDLGSTLAGEPLQALFAKAPTAASGAFLFGKTPADRSAPAGPVEGNAQLPHDPAARRLGPSGHAGAFGTLAGVVQAVVTWLDRAWLPEPFAAEAVTCQTTTLCHTGFTGVSTALDPVSRWWAVYLSNALPIDKDAAPVLRARRLFHAIAASHLRAAAADTIPERRERDEREDG